MRLCVANRIYPIPLSSDNQPRILPDGFIGWGTFCCLWGLKPVDFILRFLAMAYRKRVALASVLLIWLNENVELRSSFSRHGIP